MLYVALAQAAALAVCVSVLARLLRAQARAATRREDLLVNQLCALAGHPWQTPPSQEEPLPEMVEYERGDFLIANPEQLP